MNVKKHVNMDLGESQSHKKLNYPHVFMAVVRQKAAKSNPNVYLKRKPTFHLVCDGGSTPKSPGRDADHA